MERRCQTKHPSDEELPRKRHNILRANIRSCYPAWLGWVGVVGGSGSLIAGVTKFLGVGLLPEWLFIEFAIVVSLWMVAMGILMWRRAAQNGGPTFDEANNRVGPSS